MNKFRLIGFKIIHYSIFGNPRTARMPKINQKQKCSRGKKSSPFMLLNSWCFILVTINIKFDAFLYALFSCNSGTQKYQDSMLCPWKNFLLYHSNPLQSRLKGKLFFFEIYLYRKSWKTEQLLGDVLRNLIRIYLCQCLADVKFWWNPVH